MNKQIFVVFVSGDASEAKIGEYIDVFRHHSTVNNTHKLNNDG
jgi:hypothetical protein